MTTLVLGATGATGKLLVAQLLTHGEHVRAVVRSPERLPSEVRDHPHLTLTTASLLDLTEEQLSHLTEGCDAIASCLGHNLTLSGVFGPPRRLVTDAVRRLAAAVEAQQPAVPVRLVLMSSAGVRNRDLDEPISAAQRCVVNLLRAIVPPHADNEAAADYLRSQIGPNNASVEWVVVRPDSLTNADELSDRTWCCSPTRSAIFNPGKTSRINLARAMTELITEDDRWTEWRGRMPVVYNRE